MFCDFAFFVNDLDFLFNEKKLLVNGESKLHLLKTMSTPVFMRKLCLRFELLYL
jgi:hypothetical protein